MTLAADEFIRRFLLHRLSRIRHFGFLANACRATKLTRIRTALDAPKPTLAIEPADYRDTRSSMSVCPGRMVEMGRWPHASAEVLRRSAAPHP